jgi:hypothetical protein
MFYLLKGIKLENKFNESLGDFYLKPEKTLGRIVIGDGIKIPTTISPGADILEVENVKKDGGFWMLYDLPDTRHSEEF